MTEEEADARIAAVDDVFVAHGADPTVYGEDRERIDAWLDRVSWVRHKTPKGEWDITLRPARQRHMGTDLAHRVVARMTESIASAGAAFSLDTRVDGISRGPAASSPCARRRGSCSRGTSWRARARRRLLVPGGGPGTGGYHALRGHRHRLPGGGGVPGLRRDHPRPVRPEVSLRHPDPRRPDTDLLHQPGRPGPRGSAQRIPAGERRRLKTRKTANTNFAILNTVSMTEPVQDTTEMGRKVAEFANFWGGGESLVVQRLGDLMQGRRSRGETFHSAALGYDKMTPTLLPGPGVTPGDISFAYPGRIVDNLRETLTLLSRVIPAWRTLPRRSTSRRSSSTTRSTPPIGIWRRTSRTCSSRATGWGNPAGSSGRPERLPRRRRDPAQGRKSLMISAPNHSCGYVSGRPHGRRSQLEGTAESPQEGGAPLRTNYTPWGTPAVGRTGGTAVQVDRTASHERSPASEAAQPKGSLGGTAASGIGLYS